jgi:hypothetical protein
MLTGSLPVPGGVRNLVASVVAGHPSLARPWFSTCGKLHLVDEPYGDLTRGYTPLGYRREGQAFVAGCSRCLVARAGTRVECRKTRTEEREEFIAERGPAALAILSD